jgi:hypothetical protein
MTGLCQDFETELIFPAMPGVSRIRKMDRESADEIIPNNP